MLTIFFRTSFLADFAYVFIEILFVAFLGTATGLSIGTLLQRWQKLVGPVGRLLRMLVWVPFIIYWALPLWDPWRLNLLAVILCNSLVIALFTAQSYLMLRSALSFGIQDAILWVLRPALLKSIFVCLLSQYWLGSLGWRWFQDSPAGSYAATLIVLLLIFTTDRLFKTRFDHIAEIEGKIAIAEGRLFNFQSFGLLASVIVLMTVLGEILFSSGIISFSPVMIVAAVWKLIFEKSFWEHAYISFAEIFGGLAVGVVCATAIYKLLETNLRERLFPYLLLLNITPVFAHAVLIWWLNIGYLEKSLPISLISIYPVVESLWGLRQMQFRIALPLAIVHALPYAVAMMIFGEALASTGGLGFFMIVASAARETIPEGIAAAIILVLIYVSISELFTHLARGGLAEGSELHTQASGSHLGVGS